MSFVKIGGYISFCAYRTPYSIWSPVKCITLCYHVLLCITLCYSVLQYITMYYSVLLPGTYCSVLLYNIMYNHQLCFSVCFYVLVCTNTRYRYVLLCCYDPRIGYATSANNLRVSGLRPAAYCDANIEHRYALESYRQKH